MADLGELELGQQIIVRADEVDQIGTAIHSPSKRLPLSALSPIDGPDSSNTNFGPQRPSPNSPVRPIPRRDGLAPLPPSQPPPPAPADLAGMDPTDSLSLPQLKQLVSRFPKIEQRAYAFHYADTQAFEVEIDEWFQYAEHDRILLLNSRDSFESRWNVFCRFKRESHDMEASSNGEDPSWLEVAEPVRAQFLTLALQELKDPELDVRVMFLECVLFVLCGAWSQTSGLGTASSPGEEAVTDDSRSIDEAALQIEWMHKGLDLLLECGGVELLLACTRKTFDHERLKSETNAPESINLDDSNASPEVSHELMLLLTCWYLIIESARVRHGEPSQTTLRTALNSAKPGFLVILSELMARLRWRELSSIPLTRVLHLFWKTLLMLFGDIRTDLEHAKGILQPRPDPFSAEAAHPVLTASPLDYHLFRQELTSKYPAYNPPLPLIPLEIEQKSMLPFPHSSDRSNIMNGTAASFPSSEVKNTGSILHQPVHIATPAPSPPPSPIGPGGKGGKKQNYQTNQNFPFLYPPLDASSNNIGGKGTSELQDLMVGRKWDGSDIPTSIIEAGQLFASRMRMTRAIRQLWAERELFLRHDRGWNRQDFAIDVAETEETEDLIEDLKLDSKFSEKEDDEKIMSDQDLNISLGAVETFYHDALPFLQSLVIVMMKAMIKNVQDIAVQCGNQQDNNQPGPIPRSKSNVNVNQQQNLPLPPPPPQVSELSIQDLDIIRTREISQKALAGSIFLLLKWFKLSHILKFEYLTQLLLDSNYIPIALKYFAHQNLEDLVAIKYDRNDLSFFHFCHVNSDHPPLSPTSPRPDSEPSSSDEAVPPPINRHRRSPTADSNEGPGHVAPPGQIDGTTSESIGTTQSGPQPRPSVDELGNPLAPLPSTPITTFSFRQFQTSIHLLRILQKITRSKAHRILLLVQYKSSQILRRILRVPDPMLRLYVLKLFKSQVPYCGRKWRQSNMRVITAIYLHCRPELRDDWLAGMHDSNIEGEVDDAVPLEWALRGLTYWWQKRVYGDVMKLAGSKSGWEGGQELKDEERDFFQRELDNMGWGIAGLAVGEDVAFGEEAPAANGAGAGGEQWEQGGPLNMEGW